MSLPPLPPLPVIRPSQTQVWPCPWSGEYIELPPLPTLTEGGTAELCIDEGCPNSHICVNLPPLPMLLTLPATCKGPNCQAIDGGDIPHSAECIAEHERVAAQDVVILPPLPTLKPIDAAPIPPAPAKAEQQWCNGCNPDNCSGCKHGKEFEPGSRAYKLPAVESSTVMAEFGRWPVADGDLFNDDGLRVTPWFGMHELPNPERRGEYEVRISKRPRINWPFPHSVVERHYWNGKNWPSLMGQFDAESWRGLIERAT